MPGFDPDKLLIVLGMPRGGTTSLYHIFDQHPYCFVPFRKETSYFSWNSDKGEKWFKGLYSDRPDDQPGMDISPQYFVDLRCIDRIKALAPNAKCILSVRDPVPWIMSLFFQTNNFDHKPSFAQFVDSYTITTAHEVLHCSLADGYVQRTIEKFRESFGANLLLYRFELFRDDPLRVLTAIEEFGGMQPYFTERNLNAVKVNSGLRYNWRWLYWLLSREAVITGIDTVFPRPFIRKVRLAVDKATMLKTLPEDVPLTEEEKQLAEQRFAPDRAWVDELFAEHTIQLGDGTPFEPGQISGKAKPSHTGRSATSAKAVAHP